MGEATIADISQSVYCYINFGTGLTPCLLNEAEAEIIRSKGAVVFYGEYPTKEQQKQDKATINRQKNN